MKCASLTAGAVDLVDATAVEGAQRCGIAVGNLAVDHVHAQECGGGRRATALELYIQRISSRSAVELVGVVERLEEIPCDDVALTVKEISARGSGKVVGPRGEVEEFARAFDALIPVLVARLIFRARPGVGVRAHAVHAELDAVADQIVLIGQHLKRRSIRTLPV